MPEFTELNGARLQLSGPPGAAGDAWSAHVTVEDGSLTVTDSSTQATVLQCHLAPDTAWRAGSTTILVSSTSGGSSSSSSAPDAQASVQSSTVVLQCSSAQQAQQLWQALQPKQQPQQKQAAAERAAEGTPDIEETDNQVPAGGAASAAAAAAAAAGGGNIFDAKTEKGSAELYFHYYGMLMHQQNMLQDMTRTGTYHAAITENRADFEGKTVMDVGAGSAILSLFSAQAGAAKVYAVEASGMAKYAQILASSNAVGKAIQVCHSKVEELSLPPGTQVDVLVSEPMGTLLVNERMLETYLYARDKFLKPGGKMFPQLGRIHAAAFSDALLHSELLGKAAFWQTPSFFGLDMSRLHQPAVEGYFTQVVVDAFDPSVLVSDCATHVLDFATVSEEELYDINIPLNLTVAHPCTLHGVACWFDVLFNGSSSQRWLSTAPGLPTTHWFQLRCCLQQPLLVLTPNTQLRGSMRLVAHARQSYDVHVELHAPPVAPGMAPQKACGKFDLKEPYYRLTQCHGRTRAANSDTASTATAAAAAAATAAAAAAAATAAAAAAAAPDPGLESFKALIGERRFHCTQCGKCCTGAGEVWVSDAEAAKIARYLNLPLARFLALHCHAYSKVEGFRLLRSNMESETRDCTFLRPDNTCAIHPVRPLQCSTYPWWPELMDEKEWQQEKADIYIAG
ncbi:hypothetical protein OEZ86_010808 [Tetradesmus obliquus]|nr:hypothetical protein OEZ86_010808 [Tetradesmus obliquus]